MAENDSMHRAVTLDYVRQNNIVLVDLSQDLSGSVFEKEYKKSAKIIRDIISEGQHPSEDNSCRFCKSRNCASCKHRNYNSCINSTATHNLTKHHSAVPFIGDRGTGKSSTMRSVLERLKTYRGGEKNAAFYLGEENDDTRFIVFDMIDAKTLKSSENVMEIILGRMLTYLEDMQNDNDFRELYRQIDELHKDFGQVYLNRTIGRKEYGLTALQRVADSQKTIDNFRKLVEQFTLDISRYRFGGNSCHLVIALDDIDMYQGCPGGIQDSQFALLEHIYHHMRIPGLIVLITYNEHILRKKCNDHFEEVYLGPEKNRCSVRTSAEHEIINSLTAQFMSKLFPQDRRIYLPNYLNVGLMNHSNLYVCPKLDAVDSPLNQELSQLFGPTDFVPVKEFILRLIAHKTGVYFDIAGTKKHFFEARNLRELGELFQLIASMEVIAGTGTEKASARIENRRILLEYLQSPFALMHLNPEEIKQFSKLSMVPLIRQTHSLVDQIRRHRKDYVTSPEDIGYLDKTKRDRWKYSYGELLHNIYYSTRIAKEKGTEDTFYSKNFIHCILGTHSIMMNQMIQMPNAHDEIIKLIGSSIAGRWSNEMLPKFSHEDFSFPTFAGSISIPLTRFFNWQVPVEIQDIILDLHHCNPRNDPTALTKPQELLSEYLDALIIVGMLFTGFPKAGLKIKLEPDLDENKSLSLYLRSDSEDHVCFNVLNFVVNLYTALSEKDGYISYIRDKLLKLGCVEIPKQFTRDWEGEKAQAERNIAIRRDVIKTKLLFHSENAVNDDPEITQNKRFIKTADKWMELIRAYEFEEDAFIENWMNIVEITCTRLQRDIRNWQRKYSQFPMVLPVQHFDMMYNITKRLADSSYHDIPEEAPLEDIYDYLAQLYESVAEELESQDHIYFGKSEKNFSKAFRDNVFYQHFAAQNNKFNLYIRNILTAMLREALLAQSARENLSSITRL